MYKKNFFTPNDDEIISQSDSKSIQKAIDLASETDCNCVIIPKYNKRCDSFSWIIDETILLPNNITVILDNCYMVLADDCYCNMFCNKNAYSNLGDSIDGEQKNIKLIGQGNAVLDGGNYNNHSEWNTKDGTLVQNCTLLFRNVNGFKVENLSIINQRYWGQVYYFCRFGQIRNIYTCANLSKIDENGVHIEEEPKEYSEVYIKNGDGIDLRAGCNNILVDNVSGFTEDDSIAMTALSGLTENKFYVKGKKWDICNITVKNIRTRVWRWAAQVRILNSDGIKIHDICIDAVMDTSEPEQAYRNGSAVLVGDLATVYSKKQLQQQGDLYNISINNIFSRGVAAVRLANYINNLKISNIYTLAKTNYAVLCEYDGNFSNTTIKDIFISDDSDIKTAVYFGKDVHGEINIDGIFANKAPSVIMNLGDIKVNLGAVSVLKYDELYVSKENLLTNPTENLY